MVDSAPPSLPPTLSREVYPQAPLRAVAVEVRFPALLDAQARFGAFHRKHQEEFSRVLFPFDLEFDQELNSGRQRAAMLLSTDKSKAVAVSSDMIAAVTYDYSGGMTRFLEWGLPRLREGLRALEVSRFLSIVYRYENQIDSAKGTLRLEDVFKVSVPRIEPHAEVPSLHLYWRHKWTGGTIDVSLDSCEGGHATPAGKFQLTIAAMHVEAEGSPLDQLPSAITKAHDAARGTFEALISDSYRNDLRKEEAC